MNPFEAAKQAAIGTQASLAEAPTSDDNDIAGRATALIQDAHNRAHAIYERCPDPYRRRAARQWLCSEQCAQAEAALGKLCLRVAAAEAKGASGRTEWVPAMRRLDEGCHWWLSQLASRMGVRV